MPLTQFLAEPDNGTDAWTPDVAAGDNAVRAEFASADALHAAAADPHPQYVDTAEFLAHVGAGDPHAQYVLESALNALLVAYEGDMTNLPGNPATVRAAIEELAAKPGTFFTQTDTEADATGKAAWLLRYNATEDGVESVDPATIIPQQPLKLEDNWDPATNTPDLTLPANQVPDPTTQAAYIATADHLTDPNGNAIDGKTGDWYWWNGTAWAHLPRVDITAVTDLQAADRADDINRGTWTPKQVHDQIPVKRLDPTETVQADEWRITPAGELVRALTENSPGNDPDATTMQARNSWARLNGSTLWGDARDYGEGQSVRHKYSGSWDYYIKKIDAIPAHRGVEPGSPAAADLWEKAGDPDDKIGVPILEGIEMTFQGYVSSWRQATNVVFVDAAGTDYSSLDFQVIADSDGGSPGNFVQGYNFAPLDVNGTRAVKVQYIGQSQRRGLSAIRVTFRNSAASTGMTSAVVSYLDGTSDTIATGAAQLGAVTIPTLVDTAPADFLTQATPIIDAAKVWEASVSVTTPDAVTMRIPAGTTAAFADGTVPTEGDVVIVIPDPAGTLPFNTEAQVDDVEIPKWQYVGVAPVTPPDNKWLKIDTTGGGNNLLPAWGRNYTATGDGTGTTQSPDPGGVNEDAAIRLYNDTPATVTVRTGEQVRPFGAAVDDPDGDIDVPSGSTLILVSYGTYLRYLVGGGGSPTTLAKNVTEFISTDTTLEFYQDDPAGATDGKLYIATAALNPTLPTVVGNNGRRIGISADWAAWLAAPPTWTTDGAETMPLDRFPETGFDIVWLVADEAATTGTNWAVLSIGDITINHVVPTFNDDADAVAGTVPGSLFAGSGTGDLADALYRVKSDGSRVQGTF